MNALLYHPAGAVSAKRLGAVLGIETCRSLDNETERPEWLIRYGTARTVPYKPSRGVINRRSSLSRYRTRYDQLCLLRDAAINVPAFAAEPPEPRAFPCLGRQFGAGGRQTTGGQGITYYEYDELLGRHDFYVQFIPKDRQFRISVCMGQTRVREVLGGDTEEPVWNLDTGFTYELPETSYPPTLIPQAVGAVAALGLDFGAVDLITVDDVTYVLEVNTAPGLCDATLGWYADILGRTIGLTRLAGEINVE